MVVQLEGGSGENLAKAGQVVAGYQSAVAATVATAAGWIVARVVRFVHPVDLANPSSLLVVGN